MIFVYFFTFMIVSVVVFIVLILVFMRICPLAIVYVNVLGFAVFIAKALLTFGLRALLLFAERCGARLRHWAVNYRTRIASLSFRTWRALSFKVNWNFDDSLYDFRLWALFRLLEEPFSLVVSDALVLSPYYGCLCDPIDHFIRHGVNQSRSWSVHHVLRKRVDSFGYLLPNLSLVFRGF